jgi:hypothetical protein
MQSNQLATLDLFHNKHTVVRITAAYILCHFFCDLACVVMNYSYTNNVYDSGFVCHISRHITINEQWLYVDQKLKTYFLPELKKKKITYGDGCDVVQRQPRRSLLSKKACGFALDSYLYFHVRSQSTIFPGSIFTKRTTVWLHYVQYAITPFTKIGQ